MSSFSQINFVTFGDRLRVYGRLARRRLAPLRARCADSMEAAGQWLVERVPGLNRVDWSDLRRRLGPQSVKIFTVGAALLFTLAAPFFLRASRGTATGPVDETLVIISPHNETIRAEFSQAFSRHMKDSAGKSVRIDWRVPGGTAEIVKTIHSSYYAAFRTYWRQDLDRKWNEREIGSSFDDRGVSPAGDGPASEARRLFLESNVGIGIDLFFGGGEYPFAKEAAAGHLVDSGVMESHPEWFTEEVIPARFSGERFYDPDRRWIGTCLSTFGIAYNLDSLERLGVTEPPERWSDLGKAVYFDEIAMADPTKSGSATKAFEMLIQEQIRATFKPLRKNKPWLTEEEIQARALQRGWTTGLNLIQRICANARYFSDSSGKIPFDVMQGSAAAGMCIDFYGRTTSEFVKQPDGTSRVGFVMPENGTSVSVDPIGMLRGAPHPELAREFISFVLSPSGQQLWNYRVGEKDGPRHVSLRRLPVRRDLYTAAHLQFFSDPEVMPYEAGSGFEYVAEWTAPTFSALQFIIRCMCLDPHDELKEAWLALVENNFPPQASAAFFEVGFVDYNKASNHIAETLRSGHRVYQVSLARQLTAQFRNHYWRAAELARKGL